jgi:hypothetical protein
MAISITGSKYGNQTLSAVGTTTVTTSVAAFVAGDFVVPRLIGLWDSTAATFKGMAWVRRFISTSQLELQSTIFDPATGLAVTQVAGDVLLVSKNFTEAVVTGYTVSARAVTITDSGDCSFGTAAATGVCFYDESKEITTAGLIRIFGGLTVFGKLDDYSKNSVSNSCDMYFTAGGSSTIINTQNGNANFAMYGGEISGVNSPLYIGGFNGTTGRTMVFNGVQNPFDFISPGAGGSWGANAARQQLVNCYSITTAFNAIMRRWGDGQIVGGRYKFPNFTSGPISPFGSDTAGNYTVATPPGNRAVVLDMGNGPALVRSSGGAINFDFTNLITTDFRNVTGASGTLVANNSGTNRFYFSETWTGLQAGSVGVVVDSAAATVQSIASSGVTWTPTLLRRTCVGTTVTINSTGWSYGFKKYGRKPVSGTIAPTTYDLGTSGLADDVVFGGPANSDADAGVTLAVAAALALSSKITASSAGAGIVTITGLVTLDELYDYLVAWGASSPTLARFPSLDAYPITAAGSALTTAMTLVINSGAVLTKGVKFTSLTTGGAVMITGAGLANITINNAVTQATPTALTGVTITGALTYNTPTTAQFTLTNCALATVANTGAGIITIKRVASTLTAGANVTSYVATFLSLTLATGRVRILNHLGVEQFNQTTDGLIELPSSATGTWSYKVARYGSKPIEDTFIIDGTTIPIAPAYIPDPAVVATLAAVAAYTTLISGQQIYDYYLYYLASAAGILTTKSVTLTGALLDLGAYTLANSAVGITGNVIGINSPFISGVNVMTTASITAVTPTYPQKITDSGSTSTWLDITLNGGRIRILNNLGVEYLNTTTGGTVLLPASATGNWTYKIVKYGSNPIESSFTVDGVVKIIVANYIPDAAVVDTLANVQGYTTLGTSQRIYDYYSYFLSTAAGMSVTKSVTITASGLNLGAYTLGTGALGVSSNIIGINTSTVTGGNIVTTGSVAGITPTYPQQLTSAAGSTNWLNITLAPGQVCRDTFTNAFSTASFILLVPATATSAITLYVTKRGFKKQVVTIPYSTALLAAQAFTLIPDTNVMDVATDLASSAFTSSQGIYDAFSQYQATPSGILDTYTPSKSPGAIDFGTKGFSLGAVNNFSATPLVINSTGLVLDAYYSQQNFTQGTATLANAALIRSLNFDSEIVFTTDTITFYPNQSARNAGTSAGVTATGGVYRFKYGATVSGVVMSGTLYVRVTVGAVGFFADLAVVPGANKMDLSVQGQLTAINNRLDVQPSKLEIAPLVWNAALDGAITASKMLNVVAATAAGKATGGGTATITLRNLSDTTDAVVMSVDLNGNRSAVTLTP